MFFINIVVLIDESMTEVDQKLELWRRTLESKSFRLSMIKTEYVICQFNSDNSYYRDVSMDGQIVLMKDTF
jgi:hypothetical protein